MHLGDSIEHFKPNKGDHNKNFGKSIFKTSYEKIERTIYAHNISSKDCFLDSNLILLHLDRADPEIRIKNCLDMCVANSAKHPKLIKN
jgi:hypothetical protein